MHPFRPVKVAIIGSGMISGIYMKNLKERFRVTDLVGCSDLIPERSKARAEEFGVRQMTNEEIYNDPEIELVVNLTYHTSHYTVTKEALSAGKHVYSEKMMCITMEEARDVGRIAKENGVLFGCAPDTFLGAGIQTARQALDAGLIGTPVAGHAAVVRRYHHERFKETDVRRFAFLPGGGIMYDMGCYYLQSLVHLLGPIESACGFSQTRGANDRIYRHPNNPSYGGVMKIESPNNVVGVLRFASGALVTVITTSEGVNSPSEFVLYGTKGTLTLNDPNEFTGPVLLRTASGEERELAQNFAFKENCRGLGVADFCYAIRNGREPRASYERAIHVLEAGLAMMETQGDGRFHTMETTCTRSAPLESCVTEYPEMALDL